MLGDFELVLTMDIDSVGDGTFLDPELLHLPELSPLALKTNPQIAEDLFDQWLSLPETGRLVICLYPHIFVAQLFLYSCPMYLHCLF